MEYHEVLFERREERQDDKTVLVTFDRIRTIRSVNVTEQERSFINAGKLTSPGNISFTLLMAEGEQDPEPQTLTYSKSGPGTGIDKSGAIDGYTGGPMEGYNRKRPGQSTGRGAKHFE